MLQPPQLQGLSARYPEQIAELRSLFVNAGIPTGSPAAIGRINADVRQDPAFHRDLTSHLWVLMDEEHSTASTLLGVIALAAAGPVLAAQTSSEDAHALLRFVMEARRSFGHTAEGANQYKETDGIGATGRSAGSEGVLPERSLHPRSFGGSSAPQGVEKIRPETGTSTPVTGRGGRMLWLTAAACLLLAIATGAWLWLRHTPPPPVAITSPAPIVSSPVPAPSPASSNDVATVIGPARRDSEAVVPRAAVRHAEGSLLPPVASSSPAPAQSAGNSMAVLTPSPLPAVIGVPVTRSAPHLAAHATAPRVVLPVPASVLSKRLDSPTMPPYAPAEDEAVTRKHPRLLRRSTAADTLRENNDEIAEAASPEMTTAANSRSASAMSPGRTGIVRPTALGMMAANVLYSPAPQYPSAASAANVQGEVRVQARIDPNGNVASARVISGPPLLRDAALGAVQHWRYRPWMASGRPTATSTIAVVDFELQ